MEHGPHPAHPLVAQLVTRHGFVELTAATFDAFALADGSALVLFTEDPARYRETLDLAVIAPELARALPGLFRCAVLLPEAARAIAPRYALRRWPALVVLRDGATSSSCIVSRWRLHRARRSLAFRWQ
jgi:hydrogenase-1 operon protein HyaE